MRLRQAPLVLTPRDARQIPGATLEERRANGERSGRKRVDKHGPFKLIRQAAERRYYLEDRTP